MELATVSCNKCSASLQVSNTTGFVTCRYFGSQLEIKRTDSALYIEVLDHSRTHV